MSRLDLEPGRHGAEAEPALRARRLVAGAPGTREAETGVRFPAPTPAATAQKGVHAGAGRGAPRRWRGRPGPGESVSPRCPPPRTSEGPRRQRVSQWRDMRAQLRKQLPATCFVRKGARLFEVLQLKFSTGSRTTSQPTAAAERPCLHAGPRGRRSSNSISLISAVSLRSSPASSRACPAEPGSGRAPAGLRPGSGRAPAELRLAGPRGRTGLRGELGTAPSARGRAPAHPLRVTRTPRRTPRPSAWPASQAGCGMRDAGPARPAPGLGREERGGGWGNGSTQGPAGSSRHVALPRTVPRAQRRASWSPRC